ncbi:LIC_12616 family protein [Herbaspirillum chlorophenolicum]|uniref:LIC_12616 family protein n=1 Tax=Herbaspirillum chlorophenolicum TaxID=211589 RepID=A0ABW8F5E8_9BURK
MATISITEEQLFTALRDFITSLVDPDLPVIRGLQNRVPTPKGDFVAMSPLSAPPLSTSVQTYDALTDQQTNQQSMQWTAQIDCYGESANDVAAMLVAMTRTPYAAERFATGGLGIQPLYASDPRQLSFVTGESEYQPRWTFELSLQYNPQVTVPQQFADELDLGLINVDVEFPPGA